MGGILPCKPVKSSWCALLICFGGLLVALPCRGADGDYRSAGSGNWNAVGTWQVESNSTWVPPAATPTSANGAIIIRTGHTVTVTAAVSVDQTVVEGGGQITLNSGVNLTIANGTGTDLDIFGTVEILGNFYGSTGTTVIQSGGVMRNAGTIYSSAASLSLAAGGTYRHVRNGGAIPTATWDAASTCEITGVTSTLPTATGFTQSFGHLAWNCPSQTAGLNLNGNLKTINGDFHMVSTGSGSLWLVNYTASALVLNVAGHYIQSGGYLIFYYGSSTGYAGSMTMNVSGGFTLSSGLFNLSDSDRPGTLNVAGDFTHTGGTITERYNSYGTVNFNGSDSQAFTSGGINSNIIHYAVSSGATVLLGTQLLGNGSSGTFTLNAGATLIIGDAGGITTSGASGNIRVTGTRTYNTNANYVYDGTVAQDSGNGLTGANNLTITNSAGVSLSGSVTVSDTLALASGNLSIGANTLTLNGAIDQTAGGLTGGASANIVMNGSGAATTLPTVELNNLTVNRGNGITLGGAVSVGGALTLTSGEITEADELTPGNGATIFRATGSLDAVPVFGTSINVAYTAGGVTTGPELPAATNVLQDLIFSHTSGTVTLNADTTVNGNLVTTAGGTLDLNGYTLTVKGDVTNRGTIAGAGKLRLGGSSAQTLSGAGGYPNVELDNAAGASLAASTTINGDLNVMMGQLTVGAYSITVNGTTTVDDTLAITSASGTATFNDMTINGTWHNTGNEAVRINGNLVNAGTFNAGTGIYTLAGTNKNISGILEISRVTVTGSYTNNNTLTVGTALAGAGGLVQDAGATLNIGGTATVTALDATAAGNTVNYTYAGAQTVKATAYEHLNLGGSGGKVLTGVSTVNGNLTLSGTVATTNATALVIGGNLMIGDGTRFTAAGYALTVMGTTTIGEGASGILTISSAVGAKTFSGAVTVNPGATWNNSGNSAVTFQSGIANAGTFTAGTGVHTFDTNHQNLSGTFAIPSVTVTGITLTNNNILTVGTSLAGTGELVQAAGATLDLGAAAPNLTIATLTATAADNTVNYNGTAQMVKAGDYHHLTTSGSGTKTLGGVTDVAGDLTLGSGTTLDTSSGNYALNLAGDWINNGATFTARTGTVTLDGTSAQGIGGATMTTFNNLTLANAVGTTMGASQTVGGTLTLTSGTLAVGSNALTLNGPAIAGTPGNLTTTSGSSLVFGGNATGVEVPASVLELNNLTLGNTNGLALNSSPGINTLTFSANGKITTGTHTLAITNTSNSAISGFSSARYVVGNLSKAFAVGSGQSFTYPIGDEGRYTPLVMSAMNVGTAGSLAVAVTPGDHADIAGAGIDADRSVNRTWSLVPADGFMAAYNASFYYYSDYDAAATYAAFAVRRFTAPDAWSATTIGAGPYTSYTTISGETGFGDFAIGNQAGRTVTFTAQPPDAMAGATLSPAVQVTVTDALGVGVPSASVSLALTSGSGTLSGTLTQTATTSGVATFNNMRIDLTGDKQLTAFSGGQSGLSRLFHINPAAANKLVIATEPSNVATAGVAFAQQPVIWITDAYGNLRTNDTLEVRATRLGGAGTLLGATNVTAVGGVATFTDLAHPLVSDITVRFTSGSLGAATSTTVSVTAGPFTKLQVLMPGETAAPGTETGKTGTPSTRTAGGGYTVTVNAVDAWWNVIGTVADTVGITGTDPNTVLPADAALAGGTGTFAVTNRTAGTWTLTATDITDGGKTPDTSSEFAVNPAPRTKLQVLMPGETAAPGTETGKTGTPDVQTAGVAYTVTVYSVDAYWNPTNYSYYVSLDTTDANDGLPSGDQYASGTWTFVITNKTAGTWTATATMRYNYLTAGTGTEYTVVAGPFEKLQLLVPGETAAPGTATGKTGTPSAQTAGTELTVTANAVDAYWNVVSSVMDAVGITSTDANAVLPSNAALAAGTQTYPVTFKTAGTWTLTAMDASDGGKTLNTSPSITVGAGALAKLLMILPGETWMPGTATGKTGTPSVQTAGTGFNVTVYSVDDDWNLVSCTHTIAVTSSDGTAQLPANIALSGGMRARTIVNRTVGMQTLTVSDVTQPAIEAHISTEYEVVPGAANKLVIATEPSNVATAGVAFAQQPVIWITDAYGNLRTNDTLEVRATRLGGAGTLLGATNVTAVGGVATFTDLAHPLVSDITVRFTSGSLGAATSTTVSVTAGPFTKLQVLMPGETAAPGTETGKTGTPSTRTAGGGYTVTVNAVDAWWNVIGTVADTVGITGTDPNTVLPADAALAGGTGTFAVTNRTAGTWTLTATDITDGGKTPDTSSEFAVNPAPRTKLQVLMPGETAAPGTETGKTGTPDVQTAGVAYTVTVYSVDAYWNYASGTSYNVRLDTTDPYDALPSAWQYSGGTWTFVITNKTAGSWTATATVYYNYLTAGTGTEYTVVAGPAIKLQILVPGETAAPGTTNGKTGTPTGQTAGTPFNVTVNAVDMYWNVVNTNDTITITSSDPNAALSADAALSVGSQVFEVTFRTAGGTRTVTATDVTDPGKAPSISAAIPVNVGAFEKLLIVLPGETFAPGTATGRTGTSNAQTAGIVFTARVYAVDANWNTVSTNNTVGLSSSDPAAQLPANGALSAGTRNFILTNRTAGLQFLTATNVTQPAMANGTSTDYEVMPAAANRLAIHTQPSAIAVAGVPFAQQPVVRIEDMFGNWRSNDTLTVSGERLAGVGDLLGTTNIAAVAGVATYTDLAHPLVSDITIRFTSGALNAATSSVIAVGAAAFTKLQVLLPGETAAPGTPTGKSGVPETQSVEIPFTVTVRAVDDNWNFINTVTDVVAITSSEAGATLPANAALVGGIQTFEVALNEAGVWTVTATDVSDGDKGSDTSSDITVIDSMLQQFYLPMPEEHIRTAFITINSGGTSMGTNMVAIFSIVVSVPGTVVVYDQWEDGYEGNINSPTNANTQIWGDGNDVNGICPGFSSDPASIPAGTVLSLRNNVGIPRVSARIYYDGGDRISASRPITVTRAGWSVNRGPVMGSSAEVHSTLNHGTNFIAPLGEDVSANGMFTYSGMMIMADQDNTQVVIDLDGTNSLAPTTNVIQRGYYGAFLVNDGVKKGATIQSDKPIQVHMITGDTSANFESRTFVLHPREIWSDNYIIPVGTVNPTYFGRAYLFNPHPVPLTVTYSNRTAGGNLTIPGTNGLYAYQLPLNEGTMLSSTNGKFYAVCIMGCVTSGSGDSAYDWALTSLTLGSLTTEAVCGWGPGNADQPPTVNGNPVWVMPMADTTVYVDFDGDYEGALTDPMGGQCDVATNLAALQMERFFDPDNDQTGLRVYTLDGTLVASAWGEDPSQVEGSNPFLDMGYALVPIPKPVLAKTSTLAVDVAPSGLSLDDTLEYTIRLDNKSLQALFDVVVRDDLPPQVKYVPGSTCLIQTNQGTVTSNSMTDNVTGTPFPLDGIGYSLLTVPAGGGALFRFRARIDASGCITNTAYADHLRVTDVVCLDTPMTIRGTVWEDLDGDGLHDGEETVGLTNVMVVLVNSNGVAIATNNTDSAGGFSFSAADLPALVAGTYTVVETDLPGFLSTGDAEGANDNQIVVTVATGQTSNNNDFFDTHPAGIAGTVRIDLDGDGWLDPEDTNGLAGVTVTLYTASTTLVASTTTDAGGVFEFTNVFPGPYLLFETDPPGYISSGDSEGSNDNIVAVGVISRLDSTNHFFMDALPGSITGYSCDGDGDGFFNPATDTPLAFVPIALLHAGRDGEFNTDDDIVRTTETGLDGVYLFAALPPGAYAVRESPVAAYCYLDLADADGGDPNEIILTLGMGEDRIHQDFENTHWLGIPGVVYNASVMSSNEFIWVDKPNEQRVENANAVNADIREMRMYANASNFYIRIKVQDITDDKLAYVAIGLDPRQDAGSTALNWLGDDAGLGLGGDYYDPPAATHYPVRNIIVHKVADSARVELFASDGYHWYPPPSGWSAAIISTNSDSLELRIPRQDLLLDGTVTGRFTVASFLNTGLWANEGDSTVQAYPGTPDASDSVSIPPYGVNDGRLDVTAWREDISDADIDFWLDVRFDDHGIVDNVPPSAPSALAPTNGAEVGARPTLTWSASTDSDGKVTSYFLEVSTNENFNSETGTENGLIEVRVNLPATQTSYVLSTSATQYWWRVRARDNSGALSAGTIQSFRIGGKTDVEGPVPTLLYVGTNLTGFLAGDYDEYIARYGYIQSVTDAEVANGAEMGFAIRWEDPSGVFATNWMNEYAATPGVFTWNIYPEKGRVSPNWDAVETNTGTGGSVEWVTNQVFWDTNVSAVGNSAPVLTNWAWGAFAFAGYAENAAYFLQVSAEDDCHQFGTDWIEGSWDSFGEADKTQGWGGYAADGPNTSRNVTTNYPLPIGVQDDDIEPPVAARGREWGNDRSLLASNATAELEATGSGQAALYRGTDGALLAGGLTMLCNLQDVYSGVQVSAAGPATTNTSLSIGFGSRLTGNCINYVAALSDVADTTADTTVLAWQWAAFDTNDLAELWGGDGSSEAGVTNPVRLTLWDNDSDRPNDQAVASNVVFGYLQVLDDDVVGPRMANFLSQGAPGVLIATGFEEQDGWTAQPAGAWTQVALDGTWLSDGAEVVTTAGPPNRCRDAALPEVDNTLQLPPVDRPGWLILWARLDGPGESQLALERWTGEEWESLGVRSIAATNFAQHSWTIDSAASNEILRLRLGEQTDGQCAVQFDNLVVAPNREWTNTGVELAWSAADDAPTGDSGVSEYRLVPLGGTAPQHMTNGTSLGPALTAISPPSAAAQGVVTGYVYAADADEDRGPMDHAMGLAVPHVHRIDLTPPTVVHMGIGGTNALTETTDDPTSQFDLTWRIANVGPDDPWHDNHPTHLTQDLHYLSPWQGYKIYYGTYNAVEVPTNDDPASGTGFIYTNFLLTGVYTNWRSVCSTNTVVDPSAAGFQPDYSGLTNLSQGHIRLYDLDYDEDYVVVVVATDRAGNEGPAGPYSWSTNNTFRFALIRGSIIPKCDAEAAFPHVHTLTNSDCHAASALYWIAAGTTNEQGIYTEVRRDYDLICWDSGRFQESSNNIWRRLDTVHTNWFVDDGGHHRPRGQIRFFRASYKDRWKRTNDFGQAQRPLASEEVYALHNVVLSPGPNFVALHGVPTMNTFEGVFGGTDRFPGGLTMLPASGSTVVEFYSSGTNAMVSTLFWLKTDGHWYDQNGNDVSTVLQPPDFFTRGFSITLPEPDALPTHYVETTALDYNQLDPQGHPIVVPAFWWEPIVQVPTNGFSETIATGFKTGRVSMLVYNIVALRLPVSVHPSEMRLLECGFVKGAPGTSDEIYTMNTATKAVLANSTIYCDPGGVWRFVDGNGLVPGGFFKPNDVIVIVSRNGRLGNSWTWTYHATNFYELPTRWLGND
ncbi:MAG: hypothetical protein KBC66_03150 [Kiritimatiellae bacterium]|nr:hypothetical protein [Kiritimatiellia bacterium]